MLHSRAGKCHMQCQSSRIPRQAESARPASFRRDAKGLKASQRLRQVLSPTYFPFCSASNAALRPARSFHPCPYLHVRTHIQHKKALATPLRLGEEDHRRPTGGWLNAGGPWPSLTSFVAAVAPGPDRRVERCQSARSGNSSAD